MTGKKWGWVLLSIFLTLLVVAGVFWFQLRNNQQNIQLVNLRVVEMRKTETRFGLVDNMALDSLTITKISQKKDKWVVKVGYVENDTRRYTSFELFSFNYQGKKEIRFRRDNMPLAPGMRIIMNLMYLETAGQTSNQRIREVLGNDKAVFFRDFGDQPITLAQIKQRLSAGNGHFSTGEIFVKSIYLQLQ